MWITASSTGATPLRERLAVQQLLDQLRVSLERRLPPQFELVSIDVELTRREPENGSHERRASAGGEERGS